jgi:UDP-N-acetylglucosamine--N-acetylmuramyl-(pentapeptide) pyrophosphoryl-undecaprenol N-acetylglucosamine transferase
MRILIADGGTGGHIFPAIAVADELKSRKEVDAILFTGTPIGLESEILPRYGYDLRLIHVGGLIGKNLFTRTKTLMQLPFAYLESSRILKEFHPDIVIGFGAYSSGPVLVAAYRRKIPVLLVEPNAVPGFTNRMALKFSNAVAVPYQDQKGVFHGKAVVTGTPVRQLKPSKIAQDSLVVGILGGSQGSRILNQTITAALPELIKEKDRMHIIHQTGKSDFNWVKERYQQIAPFYEVVPFIYDVEQFYNRCDLLVCRSGAITLAEITAMGKPAILVPLATSTHGHQEQNARRLVDAGAARMILQKDLAVESLMRELQEILSSPALLESMGNDSRALGKPEAARNVATLALEIGNKHALPESPTAGQPSLRKEI